MNDTPYMYLFIREDLSHPQQIVQTAHAVDELNKKIDSDSQVNHMILFGVKDEHKLLKVSAMLNDLNIEHEMFYEPDIEAYTSIATRPLIGNERSIMSGFKLKR